MKKTEEFLSGLYRHCKGDYFYEIRLLPSGKQDIYQIGDYSNFPVFPTINTSI